MLHDPFDFLCLVIEIHALQAHGPIGRRELPLLSTINALQHESHTPPTPQGLRVEEADAAQQFDGSRIVNKNLFRDPFNAVLGRRHSNQVVLILLQSRSNDLLQHDFQISIRDQSHNADGIAARLRKTTNIKAINDTHGAAVQMLDTTTRSAHMSRCSTQQRST